MPKMQQIFDLMVSKKASDVYLTGGAPALIKFNGVCHSMSASVLSKNAPLELLRGVLTTSQVEQLEGSNELNTVVAVEGKGNFRISAMLQRTGFAVVIRYIPLIIPALETLGVPESLGGLISERRGLVLVVGSTGSGKSTTIAAMLDRLNETQACHILTVEDPIEYVFTAKKAVINQREVGGHTSSVHLALKNGLRQAPDVIFIGEIRDRETMTAALTYAQSGHLCVATLHANNTYQTLNRVLSFYSPEARATVLSDFSSALKAVVSQRLVPTIAGNLAPAVEILIGSQLVKDTIAKGEFMAVKEAMDKSMAAGSQSFEQDLARLVQTGIIEREVGMRFSDSPGDLASRLDNHKPPVLTDVAKNSGEDEPSFDNFSFDAPVVA